MIWMFNPQGIPATPTEAGVGDNLKCIIRVPFPLKFYLCGPSSNAVARPHHSI